MASDVAKSWLAGETARMMQLGCNEKRPITLIISHQLNQITVFKNNMKTKYLLNVRPYQILNVMHNVI